MTKAEAGSSPLQNEGSNALLFFKILKHYDFIFFSFFFKLILCAFKDIALGPGYEIPGNEISWLGLGHAGALSFQQAA